VLIQMYGSGFQNKRQERRNTKLYFNDVVVISETENAESVLRKEIGQHFILRDESIGPPSQYYI
jgi:hypothetical protein